MAKRKYTPVEETRLAKLRALCETLPEARIEPAGERHFVFRVGKKTFAWYLNDHHGDGIVSVCCKSTMERQRALVAAHAERYYVPAYVGPQGWVGLRLDLPNVAWDEVLELVVAAYRMQAPRRLAAELE